MLTYSPAVWPQANYLTLLGLILLHLKPGVGLLGFAYPDFDKSSNYYSSNIELNLHLRLLLYGIPMSWAAA